LKGCRGCILYLAVSRGEEGEEEEQKGKKMEEKADG
jgi:hypothetical protein